MFRFKVLMIFLTLIKSAISFSQLPNANYASVDSLAIRVKYKNDLEVLTKELTDPFSEKILKARAIFRWIAENIRYDYTYYNKYFYKGKEPKTYTCRDNENCDAKRMAWEMKYIK